MILGEYDNVLAYLDTALIVTVKDSTTIAEIYFYKGVSRYLDGDTLLVLESFDSAILYKRDFYQAWYNRGTSLGILGSFGEAVASFDSAIIYKHDNHKAWYNRGLDLAMLDRYEDALASCDSALKYNPGDSLYLGGRQLILDYMFKKGRND